MAQTESLEAMLRGQGQSSCYKTTTGNHIWIRNLLVGKIKNKKGKLENLYSGKELVCVACGLIDF